MPTCTLKRFTDLLRAVAKHAIFSTEYQHQNHHRQEQKKNTGIPKHPHIIHLLGLPSSQQLFERQDWAGLPFPIFATRAQSLACGTGTGAAPSVGLLLTCEASKPAFVCHGTGPGLWRKRVVRTCQVRCNLSLLDCSCCTSTPYC